MELSQIDVRDAGAIERGRPIIPSAHRKSPRAFNSTESHPIIAVEHNFFSSLLDVPGRDIS